MRRMYSQKQLEKVVDNVIEEKDIAPVSGTSDGTNWTSLTVGDETHGFAAGGGSETAVLDFTNYSSGSVISEQDLANLVNEKYAAVKFSDAYYYLYSKSDSYIFLRKIPTLSKNASTQVPALDDHSYRIKISNRTLTSYIYEYTLSSPDATETITAKKTFKGENFTTGIHFIDDSNLEYGRIYLNGSTFAINNPAEAVEIVGGAPTAAIYLQDSYGDHSDITFRIKVGTDFNTSYVSFKASDIYNLIQYAKGQGWIQ